MQWAAHFLIVPKKRLSVSEFLHVPKMVILKAIILSMKSN